MADVPAQAILNEAALKRFDPYVKEILDTAKFVALHTFNPEEDEWEKTNVEGSLFVYSRTGEPFYNILVLNRLNTTNLIEPISNKLDLQLHDSFLIYRNNKLCIYGIWFYEKEECTRLAALIQKLMKQSGGSKQSQSSNVSANGGSSVDIYSMLSKAQEAYNINKTGSNNFAKNVANKVASQVEMEQTPQSVMDFFAKAGSGPQKTTAPETATASRIVLGRTQSLSTSEAAVTDNKTVLNPLIHQLMSNPVHTVEHIEKQQRSVTPQMSETSNTQLLQKIAKIGSGRLATVLMDTSAESGNKTGKVENVANGLNFLRISSPSFPVVPQPVVGDVAGDLVSTLSSSVKTPQGTPQKPALMPPAMFTPSSAKDTSTRESYTDSDDIKPEPLTRNQLLQALNYLLKNDPEFMTKIHEAYVKSLTDKVL